MGKERWSEHTRDLPQLKPGQNVFIQNQQGTGKLSKRWDRTGLVVENNGHDKYTVKVDGSGRVIQRNQRYLRSFKPMNLRLPGTRAHAPDVKIESNSRDDIVQDHHTVRDVDEPQGGGEEMMEPVGPAYNPTENDVALTPPVVPIAPTYDRVTPDDQAVRRSTRVPKPSKRYPADEFDTS